MPGERLNAAEGLHWSLVGLVGHDVLEPGHFAVGEVADKGVGYFGHPLVPVLIHQVVDNTARGLGQVGV